MFYLAFSYNVIFRKLNVSIERYVLLQISESNGLFDEFGNDLTTKKSKTESINDNFWEWPTWMRVKQLDLNEIAESDSVSTFSKDNKGGKNSRTTKNSSAKKAPIVVKKVMSRVVNYSEMDISENYLYTSILKDLSFGKEKKRPTNKQEKSLCGWLWKLHSEVNAFMSSKPKSIQLILNKKHCGYTLIYEWLDDLNIWVQRPEPLTAESPGGTLTDSNQNSKFNSYKKIIKGSIMHAVFSSKLEDSIAKIVEKGFERLRPKRYNYSGLEIYFENEKNSNMPRTTSRSSRNSLTIDAYRDEKINNIVVNWKKEKIQQQWELKESLELEKEAASLMSNLVLMNPNKAMLKDLYHMCNEMMSR